MAKYLTNAQKASKDFDKMTKAMGKMLRGGKKKRKKSTAEKVLDALLK